MSNNIDYRLHLQRQEFSRQMEGAINQVRRLDEAINKINKKKLRVGGGSGSGGGLDPKNFLGGTFMSKLGYGLGFTALAAGAVSFGKAVVDSLSKAELFSASLRTLLRGDVNMANALESQLISVAKTTPFALEDVQASTKQLLAYGFSAGSVADNIKKLGDIASGVGQPIQDIVYLYGTLRTQGRAFSKDIYQFTGRGIPIVKELAKQFGVTDDKVMKLVEDGKVGFKEIERAFNDLTKAGGQFHGMMDAQSKTVGGMISNFGDSWEQLKINIGKSQTGIIANTVKWATKMVDIMNSRFMIGNFRDEATKKLDDNGLELYNNEKDVRYRTYLKGKPGKWFSEDGMQEGPSFAREADRTAFLKANAGSGKYMQGGSSTTKIEYQDFTKRLFEGIKDVKPEDAPAKLNELFVMKNDIIKAQREGSMSNILGAYEMAAISKAYKQVQGIKDLGKEPPIDTKADKNTEKPAAIKNGLEQGFSHPQNLYITINKLIETQTIQTQTLTQGLPEIKEAVAGVLLEAVSDINNMIKK